ncbi:unnamed protein product [Adineta steineri]|uniref:NAD-dependent epimerase/dehydratase domain-containing protein n=1 Tax=Adineta steineri TaxID=433720 RepID=A0A813R603_9BILA|nr:unnamed protein product [Adineta steineri]CAF3573413.1 unnamed protein product [Adineta steineri]
MSASKSLKLVLVTGAAGKIGKYFAEHANKQKYKLRLMVHSIHESEKVDPLKPFGEIIEGELDKMETLDKACKDIHTIVHLAGDPDPSGTWDSLKKSNIDGLYNIFLAAKNAGVKRMVYASSIHAISGYPKDVQAKTNEPPNPGDLYGVTKCFGEALCRYMGEKEGVPSIAVRIGAFQEHASAQNKDSLNMMDAWLSQRDCVQLLERCIDAPEDLKFAIVHGLSRNTFNRMEIESTRQLLGYDPQDNFFEESEIFKKLSMTDELAEHSVEDDRQKSGLRDKSPEDKKKDKKK